MLDTQPDHLVTVFEAASLKLDYFINTSFAENLLWLQEIEDAARKAFGSTSITLLPKTPSMKRKRPDVVKANKVSETEPPMKLTSTFMDGGKTKKLKIDDMSAIVEDVDSTLNDPSILDVTNANQTGSKRTLRTRKKKTPVQPIKRSKRLATKTNDTSYFESPLENPKTTVAKSSRSSPFVSETTIVTSDVTKSSFVPPTTLTSTMKTSPVTQVQPKVAALIEKLQMSTQKFNAPNNYIESPATELSGHPVERGNIKDIQMNLFATDSENDSPTKNKLPSAELKSTPIFEAVKLKEECNQSTPNSLANFENAKTPVVNNLQTVLSANSPVVSTPNDKMENILCQESPAPQTPLNDKTTTVEETLCEDLPSQLIQPDGKEEEEEEIKESEDCDMDSDECPASEDQQLKFTQIQTLAETPDAECHNMIIEKGRRDTYKVVVMEKELPKKSTPQRFVANYKEPNRNSPSQKQSDLSKGPKILKPVHKVGNIVTGINSFIKKNKDTPKKETEEERRMKKAAELEKKEKERLKNLEDGMLQKQKQRERKKLERIEREKRFAEQQRKRQEDEEKKRKYLEERAKQASKNKELLRKQREQEEEKKRELRELKRAEADARRQEEEQLRKQKAQQQLVEEEKRQDALRRKAEYEKEERLKKKLANDRMEKERLKALEQDRVLYEQRKMREFEEKERHRLDVEKKLKEQREMERYEKQKQDERLKAAELEIEEAKKKEQTSIREAQKKTDFVAPTPPVDTFNPPKVPLLIRESVYTSYDIDDLDSDDSTDDESEPAKRVPSWAQGINLKTQLMQQFYTNIDTDLIFVNCMEPCRLDKIFQKKKERYFKRGSSAHWTSPIMKTNCYAKYK